MRTRREWPNWFVANWISKPSLLRPSGFAMIPAQQTSTSSRSGTIDRMFAAAVATEALCAVSQAINVSLTPFGPRAITPSAALALRPVKRMCAGLWAASSSTVPLPTPAVPGGLGVNSWNVGRRMEGIILRLPPVIRMTLPDRSGTADFGSKFRSGMMMVDVGQMRWARAMGSLARLLRTVTGVVWCGVVWCGVVAAASLYRELP